MVDHKGTIVVTGRGGTGKSTFTSMMARYLGEKDVEPILLVDSDPDESLAEAALRECREETGLTRLQVVAPLGSTDWYFRAGKNFVHKYCDYFLLEAAPDEMAQPQTDEGIRACVWMGPEEALERITYANARQVLSRAVELGPKGE